MLAHGESGRNQWLPRANLKTPQPSSDGGFHPIAIVPVQQRQSLEPAPISDHTAKASETEDLGNNDYKIARLQRSTGATLVPDSSYTAEDAPPDIVLDNQVRAASGRSILGAGHSERTGSP